MGLAVCLHCPNGPALTFHETTLRELLISPYGQSCGHAFLDSIESGKVLTINMEDGEVVVVEDRARAVEVLRLRFRWTLKE